MILNIEHCIWQEVYLTLQRCYLLEKLLLKVLLLANKRPCFGCCTVLTTDKHHSSHLSMLFGIENGRKQYDVIEVLSGAF